MRTFLLVFLLVFGVAALAVLSAVTLRVPAQPPTSPTTVAVITSPDCGAEYGLATWELAALRDPQGHPSGVLGLGARVRPLGPHTEEPVYHGDYALVEVVSPGTPGRGVVGPFARPADQVWIVAACLGGS